MANTLEELPIYSKAQELWRAVSAILKSPRLIRNQKLWNQIDEANDSIIANMQEGFEQPTDAGFARYLFTSKGSLKEVLARVHQAHLKGHIQEEDLQRCEAIAQDLGPMLGGFIRYLNRSDFKDRGRYKLRRATGKNDPPSPAPSTRGDPDEPIEDQGLGYTDEGKAIPDQG